MLASRMTCKGMAVGAKRSLQNHGLRSITIGTDMLSSVISLQSARPWYMSDDKSNAAVDNSVTLKDLFAGKRVVLFGVPAPFTGTCTWEHYPGYKKLADEFADAGVDEIICYSVSDPYAHHGWSKSLENDDTKIRFLADPDATFAKAYGVDTDYSAVSLGVRSIRFSMVLDDGKVQTFREVSNAKEDAAQVMEDVKEMNENGHEAFRA